MRTGRSQLIAVRIEPTRDGINGSVLDRFLHGLTEAAGEAGYRVMLYTAEDAATEIATYDDLLGSYDLDAFVLTGTDHGDVRTAWLARAAGPLRHLRSVLGRAGALSLGRRGRCRRHRRGHLSPGHSRSPADRLHRLAGWFRSR